MTGDADDHWSLRGWFPDDRLDAAEHAALSFPNPESSEEDSSPGSASASSPQGTTPDSPDDVTSVPDSSQGSAPTYLPQGTAFDLSDVSRFLAGTTTDT